MLTVRYALSREDWLRVYREYFSWRSVFIPIPKSAFASEADLAAFRELLSRKLKRVRRGLRFPAQEIQSSPR